LAAQAVIGGGIAMRGRGPDKGGDLWATSTSPLLAIAPGPACILRSSASLSWNGMLLERHLYSPGERRSAAVADHVVSMFHGAAPSFEYRDVSGEFLTASGRPGRIMISPAGPLPDIRLHTPAELIHCAIDADLLCSVSDELEHRPETPTFRAAIHDKSMQRIIGLLWDELAAERSASRLYVDSLVHALATRYLLFDVGQMDRPPTRVMGLLPRTLNRVRERIEANLHADLSLATLAQESGYSRAHFLRLFRASTGFTPHQYVLDLRLRRAQEQLQQSCANIIDVAVSCGFASQSHMTSLFRQRFEVTPATFRRNCCR
jgi:AraC family transcriptional regulator